MKNVFKASLSRRMFAGREAIRLAWKCHHKFGVASSTEKEIAKVGERLHQRKRSTMAKVKHWYQKQKAFLFEKTGEHYIDINLHRCLKIENMLQRIKDAELVFKVFIKRKCCLFDC